VFDITDITAEADRINQAQPEDRQRLQAWVRSRIRSPQGKDRAQARRLIDATIAGMPPRRKPTTAE